MPDESCRCCGGTLLELLICAECRAPTQFICRICAHITLPRTHDQMCFRTDDITKPKIVNNLILNHDFSRIVSVTESLIYKKS